jgi:hypothetical protein
VTPGTRGVAGQWAGQAELNVDVAFRDLNTGRPLTDRPIRASSEWSQARFGDATNHQVRDASQEIMTEVRTLLANPPSEAKAESPPAAAVSAPSPTRPNERGRWRDRILEKRARQQEPGGVAGLSRPVSQWRVRAYREGAPRAPGNEVVAPLQMTRQRCRWATTPLGIAYHDRNGACRCTTTACCSSS